MDRNGLVTPSMADGQSSSVGDFLESNQVYSTAHPAYKMFSEAVADQLSVLAQRELVRKSGAKPLLLPFSLDTEQVARLAMLYPEFAVTSIPMARPVHTYWNAMRAAANEWLQVTVAKYGDSVVHFGGSVLADLVSSRRNVHQELSLSDDVAVHSVYACRVATDRVFASAVEIAKEQHVVLPRVEYNAYVEGEAYRLCDNPAGCCHAADVLCVDLSVAECSPVQVAAAMAQHGAAVAQGFFIYDPSMLVQLKGELAGTGVSFEKTDTEIKFHYPEGRVGVSAYDRVTWSRWCASHTFSIGFGPGKKWYQMELMKNRGPFMFFRMANVPAPTGPVTVTHALDTTEKDAYTVVKSWKLRDGFLSDPSDAACWEPNNFLVRTRIVTRVYEFAMQLQPANFSRHAIKKQIRVVNDRWVVTGTMVVVAPPVSPQQLEDLTTAVYVRAFVDRYESSQLTSEMMAALNKVVAFKDSSITSRMWAVQAAVMNDLYSVVGRADAAVRRGLDSVMDYLVGAKPSARAVSFERAPTYLTLTSVAQGWLGTNIAVVERFFSVDQQLLPTTLNPAGPGGLLATAFSAVAKGGQFTAEKLPVDLAAVVRIVTDVVDTSLGAASDALDRFAGEVARLNEVDEPGPGRSNLEYQVAERRGLEIVQVFREGAVADPVYSLNQMYQDVLPGMSATDLQYDTFSLSLDPQDRTLAAPYLRMSNYFGLPPVPRSYYASKLKALSVPKRQNTAQELLSAISARNLSAPAIALPQEEEVIIRDIWQNFVKLACVEDAQVRLLEFQSDPVALAAEELKNWASKAKPEVVERLTKEMQENSVAMGDKTVAEYLVMIKSDVKPTLSDKPLREITAPQVIVYHDKLLSGLYSSIFRVLVRRLLSLLKPNFHVNLLKDTRDIESFVTSCHPFGTPGLQYLENDFSKYDKSQSAFAFSLEAYVFEQLGLNQEMLAAWALGHVDCSLRSVSVGLSMHVLYQRKSGDATTAFGNVLLNLLSVMYAYQGTNVLWAVFMGDDSIICADRVNAGSHTTQVLAEVFNLTAKFYLTKAPYFASNFVLVDENRNQVVMCPDPIKRVERLSMHIAADDPQWRERWISYCDSMSSFSNPAVASQLALLVAQRYPVQEGFVCDAAEVLGSLRNSFPAFRALWDENPTEIAA